MGGGMKEKHFSCPGCPQVSELQVMELVGSGGPRWEGIEMRGAPLAFHLDPEDPSPNSSVGGPTLTHLEP